MAENVIVTALEIQGGEKVASSMKELKSQIAAYRDELVRLGQIEDKTTDEMERQEQVLKKLKSATKLLTDVTNAHKDSVNKENEQADLLNDSYNALQARLTKLKKAYKDMVSTERDSPMGQETLQEISALDVKLKELDAGMGVYSRNVGNYGQTFEQSMQQARQSAGYMQQGIGSLQGIMALMGNENESLTKAVAGLGLAMQVFTNEGVTKSIVKIKEWIAEKIAARAATKAQTAETKAHSAAMASDAVATNTATTATNMFKKALIATGIGAIIVAIGTLIAYWDELTSALDSNAKAFEDNIESQKKQLEELKKEMERGVDLLEARGATQEEVYSQEIKNLTTILEKTKNINNAIIDNQLDKWFTDVDKVREAMQGNADATEELNEKLHEAAISMRSVLSEGKMAFDTKDMTDYEKKVYLVNKQFEDMYKLAGDIYEQDKNHVTELGTAGGLLSYYQELRQWQEEQLQMIEEEEAARVAATKKGSEEVITIAEETEAEIEALLEEEGRMLAEQAQNAIDYYVARANEAKAAKEAENEAFVATLKAIEAENEAQRQATEERKRLAEEEKQANLDRAQSYIDTSAASAGALSSMLSSVADAVETMNEGNVKAQKKAKNIRIAATTIEMLGGVATAVATGMQLGPIAGPIVGAINAAAVLASGIANIAKIKSTDVSGGSSSSASASSSSASVPAPNIQTRLPQTLSMTSASQEDTLNRIADSKSKVYILQSDIEAAANTSKVQTAESSF